MIERAGFQDDLEKRVDHNPLMEYIQFTITTKKPYQEKVRHALNRANIKRDEVMRPHPQSEIPLDCKATAEILSFKSKSVQ